MDRLFEITDEPTGTLLQRAVWWAMFISEIIVTQPQIREQVPDDAEVFALPVDDPEVLVHNLKLANEPTEKPQVFFNVQLQEFKVKMSSTHSSPAAA